jgi:predicted transposase/invertase (TIGR01784 family)
METLKRMPFKAQKSVFDKLEQIVDIASLSKEERERYDESIKHYRDTIAVMSGQWEEGRLKGKQEGIKEGIKEAIKEGRLKGKQEGIKEGIIKIAKKLKSMGTSIDMISNITGLSKEEIENLN